MPSDKVIQEHEAWVRNIVNDQIQEFITATIMDEILAFKEKVCPIREFGFRMMALFLPGCVEGQKFDPDVAARHCIGKACAWWRVYVTKDGKESGECAAVNRL